MLNVHDFDRAPFRAVKRNARKNRAASAARIGATLSPTSAPFGELGRRTWPRKGPSAANVWRKPSSSLGFVPDEIAALPAHL